MRPNTPHAVLTLHHAMIEGSHFYSFRTLRDSLSGIIHTCIIGPWFDDFPGCPNPRNLLYSMLTYLHKCYVEKNAGECMLFFFCSSLN
jgi:hypothetical protein